MGWLHRKTRISFHLPLLLLEIFSKPLCSFWTWMVSILPPHHRIKDSPNGKVLQRCERKKALPRCERKKALSDLVTFSLSPSLFDYALLVCFAFLFLSQTSFYAILCLTCFSLFVFSFALFCFSFFFLKNQKNTITVCVLCTLVLVYLDGHWNKVF